MSICITFWSAIIGGLSPYIETTHIRSFPDSFWIPTFRHPFMLAAEEVLSRGPARYPATFP